MKVTEIAQKTDKDLQNLIAESRQQISQLVVDSRTKETKNVKAILAVRKQLARALTIARQRQLGAQEDTNA